MILIFIVKAAVDMKAKLSVRIGVVSKEINVEHLRVRVESLLWQGRG